MQFTLTWKNGAQGVVEVPDADLRSFLEGYWKRQGEAVLAAADAARGGIESVKAAAQA